MARVPQVTRTITTTKVTAMVVNVAQGETETRSYVLPRTYKDDKAVLKQLQKTYDNDDVKVVHVLDTKEENTLYGMTEQEFIEHAKVLPPRSSESEPEKEQSVA